MLEQHSKRVTDLVIVLILDFNIIGKYSTSILSRQHWAESTINMNSALKIYTDEF